MASGINVGNSDRLAVYCGHSAWGRYTNKAGKDVAPGGAVTVREEWTAQDGTPRHRLTEYRFDPDANVTAFDRELCGVACGTPLLLSLSHYESASGQSGWKNVVGLTVAVDA